MKLFGTESSNKV